MKKFIYLFLTLVLISSCKDTEIKGTNVPFASQNKDGNLEYRIDVSHGATTYHPGLDGVDIGGDGGEPKIRLSFPVCIKKFRTRVTSGASGYALELRVDGATIGTISTTNTEQTQDVGNYEVRDGQGVYFYYPAGASGVMYIVLEYGICNF